ncbi:maleylacetoacetate isomerase [Ralstonia solanacearum]|uniref:maleylacetoacetate isomerase n=1 Tax=Ralstonia solanacearum TaxID=305 RepID=UPI0005AC2982|nr:maleylacetoacetate isomerase [Ralstonia solanacearum]MBB6591542.1 maleylacetoacetate isomerase [Ralstonia solanacearum]MBB6595765.1 maleylacetoacetate isomerase [Ralstonia solanacearum]MDB0543834.1 maleylacetoacetate isomerase [Ralstonia solanacearum]MDB0553759.1 maleylacetoacetate isomerase [Ralstonia solanacearum]MDB0558772.1 maleylacetoacetate isomerase [Ralstonia solanacearum]
MQLYSFFNSSTSYRVRIALALKGLPYDTLPINIRTGEHRANAYVDQVNPSAGVPALVDGALQLSQSLAIIDYLDARHPEPRLIPAEPTQRARVLELSNAIACDIHPVNNLRVLRYLQDVLTVTPEQKDAWYRHWIGEGMATVERLLTRYGIGPWCFGDAPTLADVALVPQVANALRMGCALERYERAMAVYQHAIEHPAFKAAAPAQQPDFTA